jgi:D-3-phosphoglycerate dehydrogenase
MKPTVLAIIPLSKPALDALAARYDLVYQPEGAELAAIPVQQRASAVALVTNGTTGCTPQLLSALPGLKVVSAYGAGFEKVCAKEAVAAGIQVTHAPGANGATVADHAIALALAVARDICVRNAAVREGAWGDIRSARPTLSGSVVGIIGMGRIGRMVADRARAFNASIGYFDRDPVTPSPGQFHNDVIELAQASDFLFATCPGGPSTHHIVNAQVLAALGPKGFLINVSRGTVVDSAALGDALAAGTIAGAGIDVFEEEPVLPANLRASRNLVVTPHMAGRSPASVAAQTQMLIANIDAAVAGKACPNAAPIA